MQAEISLEERILAFMKTKAYNPMEAGEILAALGEGDFPSDTFNRLLVSLEAEGKVVRTRRGRYGVPERMNLLVGTLQGHERGFGFVIPLEPGAEDVFVAPGAMGGAMHGDRVVVRLGGRTRNGRNREGEIIRVLERANQRVVGVLEREPGRPFGFVNPDEKRLPMGIYVANDDLGAAQPGEKVVVEITRWPKDRHGPEGRVVERLGQAGDPGVQVLSIIHKFGLPQAFPPEVEAEAGRIPQDVRPSDLEGRLDLRDEMIVTIDGEDAKDLDDAVSLHPPRAGAAWRLGVHVADVSYYVRPGSVLDREAHGRATSVYLVDRVIPMLPPALSNGICSLNPGVDRLTMSVFLDLDEKGQVVGSSVTPSVIHSRARLTYNAVWRVIQEEGAEAQVDGDAPAVVLAASPEERARLAPLLREMTRLARLLRRNRGQRGSIDFDLPEARVVLDAEGRPLEVRRREHNFAHQLIEEFMVAANEAVAARASQDKLPFLYRVHEDPDPDRVENLVPFLQNLGLRLPTNGKPEPRHFQRIVEAVKGRPEEPLINTLVLRSMKQARYGAANLGHFGLAAAFYCHFTSPIRRYPDLVDHRSLRAALTGAAPSQADMGDLAAHTSQRERLAAEAEMESVKAKMAEYMSERLGQVFPGIVSGVTAFGVFVQLENLVEGLVHVSTMADDYYRFDERRQVLVGERRGRTFQMGQPLEVQVARANPSERTVDFVLSES